MNQLSPRVRRFVALALLVILISTLWGIAGKPLVSSTLAAIERLHDAQFDLDRAKSVVNERSNLSESEIAIEERAMRQYLQEGDSAASAVVFLQSNVSRLANENGLTLESMSSEPMQIKEPLTKVGIVFKARGSEAALVKMLSALEKQGALIVIDKLTVVAQDLGQTASGGSTTGIAVEMRLGGFWASHQVSGAQKS